MFVLVLHFVSCKGLKQSDSVYIASVKVLPQNDLTEISDIATKSLIVFFNCSISYDSISREYTMDLIDKIIAEGRIKGSVDNSKTSEPDDLRYCFIIVPLKQKKFFEIFEI